MEESILILALMKSKETDVYEETRITPTVLGNLAMSTALWLTD